MFLWLFKSYSMAFTPVNLNTTEHLADILEWQIEQHCQMLKQKCYVFLFLCFYFLLLYAYIEFDASNTFFCCCCNRGKFTTVLHHFSF